MADAAAIQLIDQLVQGHVQAGTMFTAYDVTVEARRRGARVRHDEARDRVHELFQQGAMGPAYARTAIDVGAPTRPFLYHRFSDDPSGYQSPAAGWSPPMPAQPKPTGLVSKIFGAIFGQSPAQQPPAASPGKPRAAPPPPAPRPPAPKRQPQTLGLDAAQFLPISRDELYAAAQKINLWGSPWFGRRDLIPPADDRAHAADRPGPRRQWLALARATGRNPPGRRRDGPRPARSAGPAAPGQPRRALPPWNKTEKSGKSSRSKRRLRRKSAGGNGPRRLPTAVPATLFFSGAASPGNWATGPATRSDCSRSACRCFRRLPSWRRRSRSAWRSCAGWRFTRRSPRARTTCISPCPSGAAASARSARRTASWPQRRTGSLSRSFPSCRQSRAPTASFADAAS